MRPPLASVVPDWIVTLPDEFRSLIAIVVVPALMVREEMDPEAGGVIVEVAPMIRAPVDPLMTVEPPPRRSASPSTVSENAPKEILPVYPL